MPPRARLARPSVFVSALPTLPIVPHAGSQQLARGAATAADAGQGGAARNPTRQRKAGPVRRSARMRIRRSGSSASRAART